MSCILTTGFSHDCKDAVGGVQNIWLVEYEALSAFTMSSGEVSAMTLTGGKAFFKYELPKDTASFTTTITPSVENGTTFNSTELNIKLRKLSTAKRNEIKTLSVARLIAIVKTNESQFWAMGLYRGMDMTAGSHATGIGIGDMTGSDLTFTTQEKEPPAIVQNSVLSSLSIS
jgi:hypothetical protein